MKRWIMHLMHLAFISQKDSHIAESLKKKSNPLTIKVNHLKFSFFMEDTKQLKMLEQIMKIMSDYANIC